MTRCRSSGTAGQNGVVPRSAPRRAARRSILALGVVVLVGCAPNGTPRAVQVAGAAEVSPEVSDELDDASAEFELALGASPRRSRSLAAPTSTPTTPPDTVVATTLVGTQPPMPDSVAVIGDSIALSAQELLTSALEALGIDVVAYDAVESRRMVSGGAALPSGASAIEDVLADGVDPELWVVALGTNDVGARSRPEATADDIATVIGLLPEDDHVIWVDTWVRDLDDEAVTLNGVLRLVLGDRPNTSVIDWHARGAVDGLISADGVHLSQTGKVEFARTIADHLRTTYQRP